MPHINISIWLNVSCFRAICRLSHPDGWCWLARHYCVGDGGHHQIAFAYWKDCNRPAPCQHHHRACSLCATHTPTNTYTHRCVVARAAPPSSVGGWQYTRFSPITIIVGRDAWIAWMAASSASSVSAPRSLVCINMASKWNILFPMCYCSN